MIFEKGMKTLADISFSISMVEESGDDWDTFNITQYTIFIV